MAVVVSFVGKWDGKDVARAQREIGKFSDQSQSRLGGFAKKAGVAFAAVGAAAGAAAVGVGVAAGKMAMEFDTAMTKIQALVGLTADEVDTMKSAVLDLAGETAKSPQELADGLFVVTSAGLRGQEALDALTASAKAGAAGLGETSDIARSVAGAISAYGSDVLDAASATDQIVATARAGNFETSQFAGALGRVLPFANQAGAGLDQVGGAVALLTRVNGDAAQSVTQMNALFKAFVTPTAEATKALAGVGLSAEDVRDKIAKDGLPAALDMLEDKLGGNREQLGRMLGSSEAASAAFQILDADAQTIADTFGVVGDAAGMTQEAFDTTAETAGFKLQSAFKEIQASLTELGEALLPLISMFAERITVVTDIIDKLGPVIEPLVNVLMEVGEILADILLDALDALIPAITPLLEIFGDLVRRVGPLLAKIIGKVAEVLVKLLSVVTPLLEPLIDLVFGILEAAWPIIETVIDVVLTLVDALTPLLDAVMLLLKPLGDLIELGLKAILPVIKPLLPVIEALALVLSDVLVRAIGLIMTAIGGLILAFSKVAPFVIQNVTKPVLDNFLKFAENLVGAAEAAFGWVPGLGDKLSTAKDAIGTFRKDAAKALDGAAEQISSEGEKIGKGLIDQGVQAMTNPAALNRTKEAGKRAGEGFSDGMRVGISNGQIPVQAASRDLVTSADAAARRAGEIASPSKVFARIGKNLADGLAEGVKAGGEKVRAALQDNFVNWFKETKDQLKQELDAAKEEFKGFATSVSDSITGAISFSEAAPQFDEEGNRVGMTFIEALRAQAEKAQTFAARVKELVSLGLSQDALQQVLAAGVEAGTNIANELIAGGSTAITETNDIVAATQGAADEAGLLAAQNFYGAGVESAQKTYEGFRANFGKGGAARQAVMKVMDRLARDAARAAEIDVRITRRVNEEVTRVVTTIQGPTVGGIEAAGATGGIVRRPTFALIGEAGPEAVVPLDRSRGNGPLSDLGGSNITINVTAGIGTDGAEVGRLIVDSLKAYERRNGRVYASA
jgi:TP901 family phage tail tape measure protein